MTRRYRIVPLLLLIAVLASASHISAQEQAEKRPLRIEDYALWRSIGSTGISDDGNWVCFNYSRRETDDSLYVKNLQTQQEYLIPLGSGARFSEDSKWIAYSLSEPQSERDRSAGQTPPTAPTAPGGRGGGGGGAGRKAELMNLATGEKYTWENVSNFAFSEDSRYFAARKTKTDREAEHDGTDLILRNLNEGYEELIGSVSDYSFNKPGSVLLYTVDTADKDGNGLYVIFLESGRRRPLDNDKAKYEQMTLDEEGTAVAVLKGNDDEDLEERENVLLAFTRLDRGSPVRHEFNPANASDFPEGMVVSQRGSISWNEDATRVFFGIKEQKEKPAERGNQGGRGGRGGEGEQGEQQADEEEEVIADVDIWHWNDEEIQSVQMIRAERDRNRTHQSVYHLASKRFLQLTDDEMRSISITRDGEWGIGQNDRAYISDWKENQADYYRVNIDTGERTMILEGHISGISSGGGGRGGGGSALSPDSKHFLYWEDGHVWDYVIESGEMVNLTRQAPVSFVNAEYDHPGKAPPYGVAGWVEGGREVILQTRYDLWLQPLNGRPATNLTNGVGTEQEIVFRYVRTDPEARYIDLSEPVLLSAYGQWTKKDGFYQLRRGRLTELVFEDKNIGGPTKAEDADRFMYTVQTFQDFPDYYVSDGTFDDRVKITDANPQQDEFVWGHRILFDYTNNDGVRLQGTLGIPETWRQGQKLPMLVNFYEKNSQSLHSYPMPRFAGSPNFAGYLSNGYLVMQPDIHFRTRTSHSDMLECIEAAIRKVIEMGYVDPAKVSLHGHSYSGQGSAYAATHSDMFAAIVYGAGATDLVADFNQLWKTNGTNQHSYDIYGQGRFGTNPYDDLQLYIDQSAVFSARDMNQPLLILHGTEDGSVEWLQAVEFYNALRFNGKNVILLSYPGEGHGLRQYENQRDFQTRARQFLDHYLKGEPAPDWMIDGRRFIDKPEIPRGGGAGGRPGGGM